MMKTYDQKLLIALLDFMILKLLEEPERHVAGVIYTGITGKGIIMRLRAFGLDASESTIYYALGRLRRNKMITKERQETDEMSTEISYYITDQGKRNLRASRKFLQAIIR